MQFDNDITSCLQTLNAGGIILYPTDTVWGIGCDATNENAVTKIYTVKKRNEEKSMIILVSEESTILQYISHPNPIIFDYIKGIHRPTTVIYGNARGLAKNLLNSDGSVGIRIVKDSFCRQLINRFGKPIVSTSSNVSGFPPPANFEDIDIQIKTGVDYIVQHRQNDLTTAEPSTVVRLGNDGKVTIIRP